MVTRTVTLHCTENGSDKVYQTEVVPEGDGFVVKFMYGRRGASLRPGTKTPKPVPEAKAVAIWEKLIQSKTAKGYRPTESESYTPSADEPNDTGLRPMLLTPATEEDLDTYVNHTFWGAQEKLNGQRLMVKVVDGKVIAANRRGRECSIPREVASALRRAKLNVTLDGELRDSKYHVFDLVAQGGIDYRNGPFGERSVLASEVVKDAASEAIRPVELMVGISSKIHLVQELRADRKEGVVFKRLDGTYKPGRATPTQATQVKIKFYSSGEFTVIRWNPTKQSVALGAYEGGKLVNVGNLTIPDKYVEEVKQASVVQVRYLYATDARKLYQPTLDPSSGGVARTDKRPEECLVEQLKFEGKD